MAALDVNVEQLSAYNERVLECVLLYSPDEAIFPVLPVVRESFGGGAAEQPVTSKKLPPPTFLLPGPPGSTYMKIPSWRGEPLRGAFAEACPAMHELPPTGMGTPFTDLQQLSIFAYPKGVEIRALAPASQKRSMIAPVLPTRRANLECHSYVWTNYWDEGVSTAPGAEADAIAGLAGCGAATATALTELGVVAEGCPGEDRERQYFHCATVWKPLTKERLNQVRLEIGASRILAGGGLGDDEQMPDELPDALYEPQVIVLVTKLPYHESFSAILRAFVGHHLSAMVTERGVTHDHLAELYSSVAQPAKLELPSSWRLKRFTPQAEAFPAMENRSLWNTHKEGTSATASPVAGAAPSPPPPPDMPGAEASPGAVAEGPAFALESSANFRRLSVLERQKPVVYFERTGSEGGGARGIGGKRAGGAKGDGGGGAASGPRRVLQPPPGTLRHVVVGTRAFVVPSMYAAQWEDEFSSRCVEADPAPLLTALQPSNVVRLFSAALLERSVLVLAADPKLLFDCLEALRAMLFPLTWYHIYLPALPDMPFMTGQLQAPVTYLAGACKSAEGVMENLKLENCVVADLDEDLVMDSLDYLRHRHAMHELAAAAQAATAGSGGSAASPTASYSGGDRLGSIASSQGGGLLAGSVEAFDLLLDFDEVSDWRMDQWYSYNGRHPISTLAAPLPPRYALKLHRGIRRYAPLFERNAGRARRRGHAGSAAASDGPGSPWVFLPIDLPPDASDSLRLLAAREAAGGALGLGGASSEVKQSMGSRLSGAMGGRTTSTAGGRASDPATRPKSRAKSNAAVVTLSVLNVIEGSSSEEEGGDKQGGVGSDDDDEVTTWVVAGVEGAGPTDLDASFTNTNSFFMTEDMQRKNLFALRRAFFAVLTSLLKGYREHIQTEERLIKHTGAWESHLQKAADKHGGGKEGDAGTVSPLASRSSPVASPSGKGGARVLSPLELLEQSVQASEAGGEGALPAGFLESSVRPGDLGMAVESESSAHVSSDYELSEVFDAAGFVGAREKGLGDELHLKAFLSIFLAQPIFLNYMHARTAAVEEDALDRAIYESRCRRAFRLDQVADVKRVVSLGQAFKARMDSHSHSMWGPTSWKRRVFELHHLESMTPAGGDSAGQPPPVELLCLTYFEVDPGLEQLDLLIRELKVREKSTRDASDLVARRKDLEEERATRRSKAKKGEMVLRKGDTTFHIPDRGGRGSIITLKGSHRTAFAFEIHVNEGTSTRVLTVCCDSHKDRRAFIRTLQNALVTRAEVTRMRNKYVTDEAVRARHRLLGQKRLGDLTTTITNSFPAPFLARSVSISDQASPSMTGGQAAAAARSQQMSQLGAPGTLKRDQMRDPDRPQDTGRVSFRSGSAPAMDRTAMAAANGGGGASGGASVAEQRIPASPPASPMRSPAGSGSLSSGGSEAYAGSSSPGRKSGGSARREGQAQAQAQAQCAVQ